MVQLASCFLRTVAAVTAGLAAATAIVPAAEAGETRRPSRQTAQRSAGEACATVAGRVFAQSNEHIANLTQIDSGQTTDDDDIVTEAEQALRSQTQALKRLGNRPACDTHQAEAANEKLRVMLHERNVRDRPATPSAPIIHLVPHGPVRNL